MRPCSTITCVYAKVEFWLCFHTSSTCYLKNFCLRIGPSLYISWVGRVVGVTFKSDSSGGGFGVGGGETLSDGMSFE